MPDERECILLSSQSDCTMGQIRKKCDSDDRYIITNGVSVSALSVSTCKPCQLLLLIYVYEYIQYIMHHPIIYLFSMLRPFTTLDMILRATQTWIKQPANEIHLYTECNSDLNSDHKPRFFSTKQFAQLFSAHVASELPDLIQLKERQTLMMWP